MFRALGWNVEDAREVSPEEQVSRGFVDFSFRLGGIPRFFLETKKIVANLDDPRWAQQAINYAWLKGVTWAVLSDFEGLKLLNAEWQETVPARAIFKDLHWQQYLDRFDDLWLLSRPAMEEHALDRAAEAVGRKVKKTPVSRRLFADLTEWRRELFKTLRAYNRDRSVEQIDEAVQRILDRLIFIRTCEDRGIEPYRLQPMLREWREQARKKDLVQSLNALFRQFDQAYDSRLFAPHSCEELTSEPAAYERIIEGLYEVPGGYGLYDFNAIDADVLGTIYEQYLGHRVQELRGKQAVNGQAKRKAQGIYYTPQSVVRYIVAQTLGRFLQEHDYQQARQVKVLDMACGSGSFLIEAFDVLDRYLAGVRGQNAASAAGDAHDHARRMEILTNNLYGVDLDAQAVEIAQLNLLLKAVNNRGRLPTLDNIRQGNSLVSGTPAELEAAFGPNWRDKQPFNWEDEFPQAMEHGGFDAVIGNPPYVSFGLRGLERAEKDMDWYLRNRYPNSAEYKLSTYAIFIDRAVQLVREGGYFGFVIPDSFLLGRYFSRLRRWILDTCAIKEIVLFAEDFWPSGTVGLPIILLLQKTRDKARRESNLTTAKLRQSPDEIDKGGFGKAYSYEQRCFEKVAYNRFRLFFNEMAKKIVEKMERLALPLGELCDVYSGCIGRFGQDSIKSPKKLKEMVIRDERGEIVYVDSDAETCWRPLLESGGEIGRYLIDYRGNFIYCHPDEQRRKGYAKSGYREDKYVGEKLFLRQTGDSLISTHDNANYFCLNNMHTIHLLPGKPPYNLKYILALLNSKLMNHYYHLISLELGRAMAQTDIETIEKLPVRRVNFDDPADVARHDRMMAMVEEMLRLQKEHSQAQGLKEDRRHDLARKIEQVDARIDALVYELYGLTEEEIGMVGGRD
jgi:type I restriction-modification system DNA methylase subunit